MSTETHSCAHCGATDVGSYAAGFARGAFTTAAGSVVGATLCHPNATGRPDCYRLVTLYKHPVPCADCRALVEAKAQWRPGAGWERLKREHPELIPEVSEEDMRRADEIIEAANRSSKGDVLWADGSHTYWSTHCRHGNHEACSATAIEGRQAGERVRLPRKPAQCKTCAAPCICPCHKEGT